ncbi:M15 family metallopeptidase [Cellulomonas soli]|uniref:M15 family metallopeptidase n=1 Tax=Cellulomonas soli TaxID=931535 RepID=UPI003F853FDA
MQHGRWGVVVWAAVACLVVAGCEPGAVAAEPTPPTAVSSAAPPAAVAKQHPPAPTATADATSTADEQRFVAAVQEIGPELAARMTPTSWREGCPVPLADLRYVTLTHRTFEGRTATGELVVHADVADAVVGVFAALFDAGYPVRSLRLVDDFGGSDDDSMAADNTSAFNCRAITGGTGWSEHAYGRAIDLNPVENPYVRGTHVAPAAGAAYASRPEVPGVLHDGDAVVQAFADAGWRWGGHWDSPVDYQHFSPSGR